MKQKEKIHVPKWLQNELHEKTEPLTDKIIAAYQKEGLGFSRFSLQTLALDMAALGYFHAIPNPPEERPEIPVTAHTEGKEEFTKGAWVIEIPVISDDITSWVTRSVEDKEGRRVALVYGDKKEEAEANAILISEAKNMYEAIKMELWAIENGELEAQRQGKPRHTTRIETLRSIINRINKH